MTDQRTKNEVGSAAGAAPFEPAAEAPAAFSELRWELVMHSMSPEEFLQRLGEMA